jgi:steroid delta-isomerase-like uncharacterized protein
MVHSKGEKKMKSFIGGRLFLSASVLMTAIVFLAGCQQPQQDPSQKLKPILDKWVEVWNTGNLDELDAIIGPSFVRHVNLDPDVVGLDALKKNVSAIRSAYPDAKLVVDEEIYTENKFVGRWTLTGTNTGAGEMPPTGKPIKIWGFGELHFADGKIAEEWTAYDNLAFMKQLGFAVTPPSGQKK